MMNSKFFLIVCLLIIPLALFSQNKNIGDLKKEIQQLEKSFEKDLNTQGAAQAFYKYAAEHAVIKRENDTLIIGREAIKNYYLNPIYKNSTAEWSPDFIGVSDDGTMAYTFGKYKWVFINKDGKSTKYEGVFTTIWSKMEDGSWKYVLD